MAIMALLSERRSMLNPNAPLFVPAAMREVEDFSPEWWNLVTTSAWFQDYWLSQQQGDVDSGEEINGFDGDDVVDFNIDVGVDEDILSMEAQFEEFLQSSYTGHEVKGMPEYEKPVKHWDKPAKHAVIPKCAPCCIQQPR